MNDLSMTNIQKKTKNPLNRADDMFGWKKVAEVRTIHSPGKSKQHEAMLGFEVRYQEVF